VKIAIPIRTSVQLNALRRQIGSLVGEPCWRARLAYAEELKLDFGKKVPYKSPKLKGLLRGRCVARPRKALLGCCHGG